VRAEARHRLKQDKFAENVAETYAETYSWALEHRNNLIAGCVALVIAAIIGAITYMQHRNAKADDALGAALRIYQAPVVPPGTPAESAGQTFNSAAERSRAAHAEFAKIASEYSHTGSGRLARYFSGVTAADLGDSSGAESDLKAVSDSGSDDVAALAKMALASVYRGTNRLPQAVDIYKQLIANPTNSVPKVAAQLELAKTYQPTQPAEAAKIYAEIAKDNSQGTAGRLASTYLQQSR
jgi:predicted negative regulator of RcsB-dependent stress response